MNINEDVLFLLGVMVTLLFLPSIISKLSLMLFKRHLEFGNSISESYKDDRITEEMVSGAALLQGRLRGP